MTLFRFHLSTLLLLTIFSGAIIGLTFTPHVWQLKANLPLDPSYDAVTYPGPSMAFSQNNTLLAVLYNDKCYCFDIAAERKLWYWPVYPNSGPQIVQRLRFADNDTALQFQFSDNTITRIGVSQGDLTAFINIRDPWDVPVMPDKDEPHAWSAPNGREAARGNEQVIEFREIRPNFTCGALLHRLETGAAIHTAAYSPDCSLLAINTTSRVAVWKRTRPYGWRGWLTLPLFWPAALTFAALLFTFARWTVGIFRFKNAAPPVN